MKTVVFDFDGVIHSYKSGWQDIDKIPDEPVSGIRETITDIRNLDKYNIVVDDVCAEKPPAIVYIDDRAICFDGNSSKLLNQINKFTPWHQKIRT